MEERELDNLLDFREGAYSLQDKLQLVANERAESRSAGQAIDKYLIGRGTALHEGLTIAQEKLEALDQLVNKITEPPWYSAIYIGPCAALGRDGALVNLNGQTRVVALPYDLTLQPGETVMLNAEANAILGKYTPLETGDTVLFDRYIGDGRAIVKVKDEEIVCVRSESLKVRDILNPGDLVRWDKSARVIYEKIDRTKNSQMFLEDTPRETFANIGGLDLQIVELQRSIRLHKYHAKTVAMYKLRRKGSVLLYGPAGTGKTMMARALANWLASISKSKRARFINIKPSALNSMWFGASESNYREVFRVAREAGEQEPDVPVVMFFDEIDAIGSARGETLMRVDDKVLTAFMAELDGLESRGNIMVVAATNRRDTLDPALLRPGRLGDLILEVPRPNALGAKEIFFRHLEADIPYREARTLIVDRAVDKIYAGNGETALVELRLPNGRIVVHAGELMSGASIAKIALSAKEMACIDDIEHGQTGVALKHVLGALTEELINLANNLTPKNIRQHMNIPVEYNIVDVTPLIKA